MFTFSSSITLVWIRFCTYIWNSGSITILKNFLLQLVILLLHKVLNLHNPQGLKLMTSLRLDLSHLGNPKFESNLLDTINPFWICGSNIETSCNFFSIVQFLEQRTTLLNNIPGVNREKLVCTVSKIIINSSGCLDFIQSISLSKKVRILFTQCLMTIEYLVPQLQL